MKSIKQIWETILEIAENQENPSIALAIIESDLTEEEGELAFKDGLEADGDSYNTLSFINKRIAFHKSVKLCKNCQDPLTTTEEIIGSKFNGYCQDCFEEKYPYADL